jgi:HEPN domain-containing protein
MAQHVHRLQWQELARTRLREAKVLLSAREWSGAYYLSGYAVECGLKACASRTFPANAIPDKDAVLELYKHKLESLLKATGLEPAFRAERRSDHLLDLNWTIVKDWDSIARYTIKSQGDAEDIIAAITNQRHGVMKWVRSKW